MAPLAAGGPLHAPSPISLFAKEDLFCERSPLPCSLVLRCTWVPGLVTAQGVGPLYPNTLAFWSPEPSMGTVLGIPRPDQDLTGRAEGSEGPGSEEERLGCAFGKITQEVSSHAWSG